MCVSRKVAVGMVVVLNRKWKEAEVGDLVFNYVYLCRYNYVGWCGSWH